MSPAMNKIVLHIFLAYELANSPVTAARMHRLSKLDASRGSITAQFNDEHAGLRSERVGALSVNQK